jgi:hypothetical protein
MNSSRYKPEWPETGTGWTSLYLVLFAEMGHSGRYRNEINNYGVHNLADA